MAKDTVATVKRNFDIRYQVEQHPWAVVGGGFLVGLALGGLLLRVRQRSRQSPNRPAGNETSLTGSPRRFSEQRSNDSFDTAAQPPRPPATAANRPGVFGRFHEEIDKVKGMAIGYVMGLIRDSIKDGVPQMASQIDDVMTGLTTKLGGQNQEKGS
jgi:hypothetical protein